MPIPANFYATAALELPWYPFYGADKRFYTNEPHQILYWAKGWMGDIPGAQKPWRLTIQDPHDRSVIWVDLTDEVAKQIVAKLSSGIEVVRTIPH